MSRMRSVVAVVALLLLAASCSPAGAPDAKRELVWAVGGSDVDVAAEVVELWRTEHPQAPPIRIERLPRSSDDQRQLLAVELNAEIPDFDILSLDVIWTGEFAENGWLADLEAIRSEIARAALPGPLQSATWNGTLWAAPYTTNAGFLYYRTDLVATPPRTWEELVRIGLEVRRREAARGVDVAPLVGQGAQYEGLVVNYLEYLWGAGGRLLGDDGTHVSFDEGPAMTALRFMETARREGVFPPEMSSMRETEATHAFGRGDAVFMRNWPNAFADLNGEESPVRGKVGIAPLPTFDGRGTTSVLGGLNLGVSRFSRNTGAARDFVRFAATAPTVQRLLADRSFAPAMASAYEGFGGHPVMALLGRVLPEARPRPPAPEWSAISDEIQQQVYPAYNGQRDPEQAVDAIRRFLELAVAGS